MGRRLGGLGVVLLAVAMLSASAGASQGTGGWQFKLTKTTAFSGTFTNPTASVINGVSIGTQAKAKNPITSFEFAGQTCKLYAAYGSAFCYTGISVKPGKTVSFSGMAKKPVSSGGLQMCTTADGGMDNTCVDVASTATTTSATARKEAAAAAFESVLLAISEESTALKDLNNGDTHAARNDLAIGAHKLDKALAQPFDAADIAGDLKSAYQDDSDAYKELEGTKPGKIARARAIIKTALGKKQTAALDLNHIAHS